MTHATDNCRTVVDLFETQVRNHPTLLALQDKHSNYTYALLNEKANQVAFLLKEHSVQCGDLIALLLEPSAEFIVCILAIVKLGAVYVPLDIHAPRTRLKELLTDTQARLIIANESFKQQFSDIQTKCLTLKHVFLDAARSPIDNIIHDIHPESPICMMYTSGSTGRPKGVIIPHQAVRNIAYQENTIALNVENRMAQFSNIAFDGSTYEIWTTLLNGGTLCIIPNDARHNHAKLRKCLLEFDVTFLFLPTSYLHQLIQSAPETLDSIHALLFGGEQINVGLITQFIEYRRQRARDLLLINGYGPTETTAYICRQIIDTRYDYSKEYLESIGQLVTHTKSYILDEHLNPVVEGELYISGANLSLGYHNSEQQNNQKFIANPFDIEPPYTRLYKTGDKVKQIESGDLLFLGRYDDQVKVGGFRIHLNEIETTLMQHPKVTMATINVELGGGSHKTLTAYIVFASNELVYAEELRDFMKQTLPVYMLPAKWYKVDKLPLNLIGKVDKSKLEKMSCTDLSRHIDSSSDSPIQEQIKEIWQHLLNRDIIDVNKNLFDLGANSLLLIDACSRINKVIQSELHVGDLLAHPTIYKLSRYIEGDIEVITPKKRRKEYSGDIAIIGMSCRFPGASNLDDFWSNLCKGNESLERFEGGIDNNSSPNYVPVRGVVDEIDQFDASFFGFNAIEASLADPQQRLLLECSWHALEHAAIAPQKNPDKIISVFSGMSDSSYLQENLLKNKKISTDYDVLHQRIATSTSMLSTQISYRLNLQGRSVNVNTACSTGLLAVDQACQDLLLGYSDVALAGASSIIVPQTQGYVYQEGSIVSADGHCRPFSDKANGTVFSNGVGVVVLKRLNDAVKDNDTIYAVIKGRGINNDGSEKLGFTAPSTHGQMVCIRSALEDAHVRPEEIGYIEAHGTATSLGDAVEIDALKTVYKEQTDNKNYCALGSVKANIGHTDVVAGIAGLIKTALCLYHQKIPPLIHYNNPNPHLELDDSPFYVNKTLINWDVGFRKRYAAVSSFGVGGTNAHMILGEHDHNWLPVQSSVKDELFIVSAKSSQAVSEQVIHLVNKLSIHPSIPLSSAAYTLQTGREDFPWRRFAIGSKPEELHKSFTQHPPFFHEEHTHESIIFMFPGQGSQYPKMAMELYETLPEFARYIDKGISLANQYLDCDLLELIKDSKNEHIHLTQYAQPALFIIEYALAQLLLDYGIKPDALIGHSLGEYVAACVAGVFSFEEGISLICHRGLLMASAAPGAMIAVECNEAQALALAQQFTVSLALHNSPKHCVLSGALDAIEHLENHLQTQDVPFQKLHVSHAFHSALMEPLNESFMALFDSMTLAPPSIDIISNVTGDWIPAAKIMDASYWYQHLRQTVKMSDGFETALQDKHPFFIEVGLGHSLSSFLRHVIRSSNTPHQSFMTHLLPNRNKTTTDLHQLLTAVGQSWELGITINWQSLHNNTHPVKAPLPLYPFQKSRYWIEPDPLYQENEVPLYVPAWTRKALFSDYDLPIDVLKSHTWIILKDKSELTKGIISLLQKYDVHLVIIDIGTGYKEHSSDYFTINPANKEDYGRCFKSLKNTLKAPYFIHSFSIDCESAEPISPDDIKHNLELGFYSILYLTQGIIEHLGADYALKGMVLTKGTHAITGAEHSVPTNACLSGAVQVINKEYPALNIRVIDLDEHVTPNSTSFLINQFICPWMPNYTSLALRHNAYWELSYQNLTQTFHNKPFKDNGVYFITGGLGGIALALCEVIVAQCRNPHLVLISRSPSINESNWEAISCDKNHPHHQTIETLRTLKNNGAFIHWFQTDITEFAQLQSLVNHCIHELGSIDGLIHAAGIAGGGIIPLKQSCEAEHVLKPKIQGTYNLAQAFKNISLDYVVFMSSLVALVGEPGQIDYAAANASLNTFATTGLFNARTTLSINWNTWNDVGMAVHSSQTQETSFLNRGNDISSEEGKALFLRMLQSGYSQVVVSNYELKYHDLVLKNHQTNTQSSTMATSREVLLPLNTYCAPRNAIELQLASLWQAIVGIESIGIDDNFFTLGGHSLNALQLIDKMNRQLNTSLSIQHFYKYPTIRALSEHLQEGTNKPIEILVPLNKLKTHPPYLFVCHPASGMIYCFEALSSHSPKSISVFGIQDPSITEGTLLFDSVLDMAEHYLTAIKRLQPHGPYHLMGYSFGGSVLYEVAHLLAKQNEEIALLALIDSWAIFSDNHYNKARFESVFKENNPTLSDTLVSLAWSRMNLLLHHKPTPINQEMILFKATELLDEYQSIEHPTNGWSNYNQGSISCYPIKANHDTLLNNTNSLIILDILKKKGIFS